ncbi:MAG: sterol carrier protein domain-containing protein, partial [Streptosporangiaceae bacterium]
LRLRRGEGRFDRRVRLDPALTTRLSDPADARKEIAQIYDDCRDDRPGSLARDDAWWDKLLADVTRYARDQALQCAVVEDGSGPRGYAFLIVRQGWDRESGIPDNRLTVLEPTTRDPEAYAALWQHALDRDLVEEVIAPWRPVDEPLLHLLADPRRARVRVRDDLWVRVVDVDRALAARAYARPIDIVIQVTDPTCPWNAGRWRLAGDESGATCEHTRDAADAEVHVRELGAAYLGDADFSGPAGAGLARESTTGALRALAAAMGWAPKPLCTTMF